MNLFNRRQTDKLKGKEENTILTKEDKKDFVFLLKKDKRDIIRLIYLVGLIQFLAIVASIVFIIKYYYMM